jgi:thiamine kinase-like enzyme
VDKITERLQTISNSGAVLRVEKRGGQLLVVKSFIDDIDRAVMNVDKQRSQMPVFHAEGNIFTVKVLNEYFDGDVLNVEMEYVEGISADQFVIAGTRQVAGVLKSGLNAYLLQGYSNSKETLIDGKLFVNKINSVISATQDEELSILIERAGSQIESLASEALVYPVGKCHGDFTLSNMIVTHNLSIYLIDFLSTFFESPLQDAVKLLQDFKYGWSFRFEQSGARLKAKILCLNSKPNVISMLERMYPRQMKILLLLSLSRIAPYVEDTVTRDWLIESLSLELEENC